MLKQSYMSNKELENYNSRKGIVPIQGRLYLYCVVQSIVNMKLFTTSEVGESSGNMKNFDVHVFKAMDNAIYKHISRGGKTGARVIKVNNYEIKYFNDDVKVKRKLVKSYRVVNVPPSSRIVRKVEKIEKVIKVKSHIRNGVKVRGYERRVVKEKEVFKEVLVKGYQYRVSKGKGSYKSVVKFKDKEIFTSDYKIRSLKSINKDVSMVNRAKNSLAVDRI